MQRIHTDKICENLRFLRNLRPYHLYVMQRLGGFLAGGLPGRVE